MMSKSPLHSDASRRSSGSGSHSHSNRKLGSSVSRSQESSRRNSSNSSSFLNSRQRNKIDARLCSALSHHLGLPLLLAMNGKEIPSELKTHLPQLHLQYEDERETFTGVFADCVRQWITERKNVATDGAKKPGKLSLTSGIVEAINNITNDQQQPFSAHGKVELVENSEFKGKVDIILSPKHDTKTFGESSPLMVMEVGLNGRDWFRRLDQGWKYLRKMRKHLKYPLLFAVITIDDQEGPVVFQMGVLLCIQKHEPDGSVRMALLRQFKTNDQGKASEFFGRMLWLTKELNQWRKDRHDRHGLVEKGKSCDDPTCPPYHYFSSNCCRIGHWVVRIYDNRFRQSQRTPVVYLNCGDIVGKSSEILSLKCGDEDSIDGFNVSTIKQGEPILTIISTPYYEGGHIASNPSDFVPLIQQLQELHKEGYVHGDIRAFNTIIGGGRKSWLIDFDFGGKANEATYPTGYNSDLSDGKRLGKGGARIMKWHDWFALSYLIFHHYSFLAPHGIVKDRDKEMALRLMKLMNKWGDTKSTQKVEEDVEELIDFLNDADTAGYTLKDLYLKEGMEKEATAGTFQGATGSPSKKNA